ncbi:hypothetical protein PN466_16180 [Roseofilum reptotaenium CS-1145]|uniref:Uncharacterized protein n=1 Tax=Roseofilum reptotaenium AO1-A TaxID=1925591 RepID=A0A1L9QWW1_9CYAN|nr:hypothetical protein [Roseofilum reptotaenium]MDB9518483.1 hypothetical protein [Roseofilum reptotaenium CS-1145]OJJ27102.1 hypothetical protein BI308_03390 [Roseofilum reptotaenium AO1-A]
MSYSSFKTLASVQSAFGLELDESQNLFAQTKPRQPSDYLAISLAENVSLANAVNTEKARSELIIAPVLLEIRRSFQGQVGFFSGTEFSVEPEKGLHGYCDYILTASSEIYEIKAPIIAVVEAKNENIKGGLAQCLAEMVAVREFNAATNHIGLILGAVTTGTLWKFLTLNGQVAAIDLDEYYIKEVAKILGILATPLQQFI